MQQFIVTVNGPICGGKSVAVDSIMSQYKKVFRLSANKIKFLISDYTPNRDRDVVHECLMIIADKMLERGMSLVLESGSVMQGDLNDALRTLAEKHGIKITSVNIEAPIDVLKKRFQERLDMAEVRGSRLSVTDEAGFMERYNAYMAVRPDAQETFDSSVLSPEEIAAGIMKLV